MKNKDLVPSSEAGGHLLFLVTSPPDSAEEISRTLVEEGLAACCNIVKDVLSIYRWKGEVCTDPEALLFIKTRLDSGEALTKRIREIHPYDVPEIIGFRIATGNREYLEWLDRSTSIEPGGDDES